MDNIFNGQFFEMLFIVCFGIAWPTSIVKSIKSKTAKGKSMLFLIVALLGYTFGITAKLVDSNITYVFFFYCLNFCMVATDTVLYFINRRRDRQADAQASHL
jgi:hypothetical protein